MHLKSQIIILQNNFVKKKVYHIWYHILSQSATLFFGAGGLTFPIKYTEK